MSGCPLFSIEEGHTYAQRAESPRSRPLLWSCYGWLSNVKAERCFLAWRFKMASATWKQALSHFQKTLEQPTAPPASRVARYYASCAMAVA